MNLVNNNQQIHEGRTTIFGKLIQYDTVHLHEQVVVDTEPGIYNSLLAVGLSIVFLPFVFDPARHAILQTEFDARYARLYGLTRDELRYILDSASVMG
jgi:hypothetical protein